METAIPGRSGNYRPAKTRARIATACLVAMGFLAVLSAVHFLQGFDLAARASRGAVNVGEGEAFDAVTDTLALVSLSGVVVTGIAWLVWLHRAVANAAGLGKQPGFTPGWAVGWWFVPIANAFQPYRIVRSLMDALGARTTMAVLWWWGLYLAAGLVANFAARLDPEDLNGFRVYLGMSLAVEVFRVAAATLAIVLISTIERLSEDSARAPAPATPVSDATAFPSAATGG